MTSAYLSARDQADDTILDDESATNPLPIGVGNTGRFDLCTKSRSSLQLSLRRIGDIPQPLPIMTRGF